MVIAIYFLRDSISRGHLLGGVGQLAGLNVLPFTHSYFPAPHCFRSTGIYQGAQFHKATY